MYYQHVYPWFGLPSRVISDHDPHFTSHFGRSLAKELGVTWNLSTAYHPQTDGLSEWKNQWVEQFLQLVATNQEEWSMALPLATLVHNNSQNATIRTSPNQLLIGLEPPATPNQVEGGSNPLAEQRVRQLRERRILAMQALNRAAKNHALTEPRWKKGQEVWLEAKNLSLPYGSVKLAPRRHGPFRIEEAVSPVAYKLRLPLQWTIHPVFHASLLTPFVQTKEHRENYSRPPPDLIDDREQYEVETIRSHRRHGKKRQLQYLVKWKGYPESDNTWEPVGHIQAPRLIKEYEQRQKKHISMAQASALQQSPSWVTAGDPSSAPNPKGPPSLISILLNCFARTHTRPTSSPSLSCTVSRTKIPTACTRRSIATSPTRTPSPLPSPAKTSTAPVTNKQCRPTTPMT